MVNLNNDKIHLWYNENNCFIFNDKIDGFIVKGHIDYNKEQGEQWLIL